MAFPMRRALCRSYQSDAAVEALGRASAGRTPNLVLYNYPSISGSLSALFARLYHSRLNLPCLILPFSSFVPFTVADLTTQGLKRCFLLDFLAPKGFALQLSKETSCQVILFHHRIPTTEESHGNLKFHIHPEKITALSVYEYFSKKLSDYYQQNEGNTPLLDANCQHRMERLLDYIGDRDLCKGALPDIEAFNIGIKDCCPNLNCITNVRMYEQLTEIDVVEVIAKGNSYLSARRKAVEEFLNKVKVFKLRLGRGLYGECLGIRADDNPDLKDELAEELCRKSAEAGLRPIGAVIYMKRKNLKMCLWSNDSKTDVSQIAKAYGGGGNRNSSSFIIRMDEYNQWCSLR